MLKLSKRTEYAIMAARYLALKNSGNCVTAKEIAEDYQIPYQFVAKVLQDFARTEMVSSIQGSKGGYVLNRLPEEISLIDIISTVEENHQLTECMQEDANKTSCEHIDCCKIRDPLIEVQRKIDSLFAQTSLKQIL
ncbi:MAG: Rrf2 family transcriptional regulator [Ignavibacterium sp.]|nr:MAG: Rrf2 family transcriptional regulator [Ignavibacterium sp.]